MAAGVNFMETPLVLWVSTLKIVVYINKFHIWVETAAHLTIRTLQVETFRNGRALEFKDLCDGVFLNDVMLQM